MASSKFMTSSTSRNSDLRLRSSSSSTKSSSMVSELHLHYNNKGPLRNVCGDNEASITAISDSEAGGKLAIRRLDSANSSAITYKLENGVLTRQCKQEVMDEMMTLEDFLAKAEAVEEEEDLKIRPGPPLMGRIFAFDPIPPSSSLELGFGNGGELVGGRGKRRAVMEEPLDKAAEQRQRRMIKNRESAARSRERKQAYQVELEALALKLEKENEQLLKEMAEQMNERYKEIKEKVIPVEEMRRPKLGLRRVSSMDW